MQPLYHASLEAECDDYQTKPIDEVALLKLIGNYLGKE